MSQVHWLNAIDASFTNAADWGGGVVPGASDDAILDAVGSTFTVTSGTNETVESVQLAANATLSLTGKIFKASAGTGAGANAGIILVGAGASLVVGGTVTNTGTIVLGGAAGSTGAAGLSFDFITTLTGGGEVLLEGYSDSLGPPGHANSAVYNVDNTIVGSGTIAKKLEVINEVNGVIDASGGASLVVRGEIRNDGLIEASGSGGLVFRKASLVDTATGVVLVGDGSKVELVRSDLGGGMIEASGSGKVIMRDTTFTGNKHYPLIVDAPVKLLGICTMSGTIENNGTISLSKGLAARVDGSVILEGDGVFDLGGRQISAIGGGASLNLQSGTIRGAGEVVGSAIYPLTLTIGAAGVIDSNGGASLTLNTHASLVNAGTLESTGLGGLLIDDAVTNNGLMTADAGTLTVGAAGTDATLVNRGTLSVESGGTLVAYDAVSGVGVATIGGGSLEFLSRFNQQVTFTGDGGTLELARSQMFTRSVNGFSTTGKTALNLGDIAFVGSGEATFSGNSTSGVLTVTDGTNTSHISLNGDYLGATFVASSDGHGGVMVVAESAAATPPHAFVSAMAQLAPRPGGWETAGARFGEARSPREPMLLSPRAAAAP